MTIPKVALATITSAMGMIQNLPDMQLDGPIIEAYRGERGQARARAKAKRKTKLKALKQNSK